MGKNISPIVKFQGTIGELVFVNSKTYKPHVRSKKYSKTPFKWTANFAENNQRLHACDYYASLIFQALRPELHDGLLWSRILKLLFAGLKAGEPLGLERLKGLECNLKHPLNEIITGAYDFSATREQNEIRIRLRLEKHPVADDTMPRTGYQLRIVAIFPDPTNGRVIKREALGPLTKYDAAPEAVDLTIPLLLPDAPCMLLMGIVPHLRNEGAVRIMSDSGMKVIWVEEPEVENQSLEVGSQQLPVESPLYEAIQQPEIHTQHSTSGACYWQPGSATGFVRFSSPKGG